MDVLVHERISRSIQQARAENPVAYARTLKNIKSISKTAQRSIEVDGMKLFSASYNYAEHKIATKAALHRGERMYVTSTAEYWNVYMTKPHQQETGDVVSTERRLYFESEDNTIVAPLSECLPFKESNRSLAAICLSCLGTCPFASAVVCKDCLAACYCSDLCQSQHALGHAAHCKSEIDNAHTMVNRSRQSANWPLFGSYIKGEVSAVPWKDAIESPVIPTTLVCKINLGEVRVLLQNTALLLKVTADIDRRAALAEAMRRQLLEEEQVLENRKGRRRSRKKGKRKEMGRHIKPPEDIVEFGMSTASRLLETEEALECDEAHCTDTVPTCVVCIENRPEYVIVPCGHLCLCKLCGAQLRCAKCPLCNGHIERVMQIFMP